MSIRAFGLAQTLLVTPLLGVTVSTVAASVTHTWPEIKPVTLTFKVTNARTARVDAVITGRGHALYKLECRTWVYGEDRWFDYSGDFECRLVPLYGPRVYSTLLGELPTHSWASRARFFVSEIRGTCGDWADYGRLRTFALRGFRLTLRVVEPIFRESRDNALHKQFALEAFTFEVGVVRDRSASTSFAAPTSAPTPPHECENGYVSPAAGK
jgi:hypothetical protein